MTESFERIRILRIIARMNIGGPAIQVTNLMNSLPKTRFEQLLITGYCQQNEQDYLETQKIPMEIRKIKHLGRSINPLSDLLALYQIRKIIKEYKPDIIHTHTFKAGLVGRLATMSVAQRIKLVHTFHGHLLNGYFRKFGTRVVIAIERILAKITTRLISVGEKVRDDLLEKHVGVPNQYKVINPGFTMNRPLFLSRRQYGLSEDAFVCGWFGRLTQVKRAERILEISELTTALQRKNVTFLIVGDGENRNFLEGESIRKALPIKFIGWQSDVASLMKICNLIICTSDNEGTPISLIEAQMLGLPVLSTNVGSVQEVMIPNETGFILDYNAETFWQIIDYLSHNPQVMEKLSRRASKFALEQFSLEKFISKHISVYTEVLTINPISCP